MPLSGSFARGFFFSLLTGPVMDGRPTAPIGALEPLAVLLVALAASLRPVPIPAAVRRGLLMGVAIPQFFFFVAVWVQEAGIGNPWVGAVGALGALLLFSSAALPARIRDGRTAPAPSQR
jgi:hypothetical protein